MVFFSFFFFKLNIQIITFFTKKNARRSKMGLLQCFHSFSHLPPLASLSWFFFLGSCFIVIFYYCFKLFDFILFLNKKRILPYRMFLIKRLKVQISHTTCYWDKNNYLWTLSLTPLEHIQLVWHALIIKVRN